MRVKSGGIEKFLGLLRAGRALRNKLAAARMDDLCNFLPKERPIVVIAPKALPFLQEFLNVNHELIPLTQCV